MKIKLTNGQMHIYLIQLDSFVKHCKQNNAKVSYAVARNQRILKQELTEYSTKRDELIKKFGEINEVGNYIIDLKNIEATVSFNEGIKEYEDIEVDVDIYTLTEDILEVTSMTAIEMSMIEFMFAPKKQDNSN